MKLRKLPSVIIKNKFDERGLVESNGKVLVPVYVASQFGFDKNGRKFLESFYTQLREEAGVLALCPFAACAEYLDLSKLSGKGAEEQRRFWERFNGLVGIVNYETLMPYSRFMIALLEGAAVDDGVAAEVAYFSSKFGSVVGIRSDVRTSENIASINPAVRYFLDRHGGRTGLYKGYFFKGEDAYKNAVVRIKRMADKIRRGK